LTARLALAYAVGAVRQEPPIRTMETPTRRDSIHGSIARRAGPHADARAVAQASLQLWLHMAAQLEPVIGARGVDALFGRALHLTGKAYPWLTGPGPGGGSALSLDLVRQRLEEQAAGHATGAACALLTAFTELLATLIGDSLTNRLLAPAWEPPAADTQQDLAP